MGCKKMQWEIKGLSGEVKNRPKTYKKQWYKLRSQLAPPLIKQTAKIVVVIKDKLLHIHLQWVPRVETTSLKGKNCRPISLEKSRYTII